MDDLFNLKREDETSFDDYEEILFDNTNSPKGGNQTTSQFNNTLKANNNNNSNRNTFSNNSYNINSNNNHHNNIFTFNNVDDEDEDENYFISSPNPITNNNNNNNTTTTTTTTATSDFNFNFEDYDNSTLTINNKTLSSIENNLSNSFGNIHFSENEIQPLQQQHQQFQQQPLQPIQVQPLQQSQDNIIDDIIDDIHGGRNELISSSVDLLNNNIINSMPGDNSFDSFNNFIDRKPNSLPTSPLSSTNITTTTTTSSSTTIINDDNGNENGQKTTSTTIINSIKSIKQAILNKSTNFNTDKLSAYWKDGYNGNTNGSSIENGGTVVTTTTDDEDNSGWLRIDDDIPQISWSKRLDYHFPEHKHFQVSMFQGLKLVGLGYRMWKYVKKENSSGRVPVMDPFNLPKPGPIMGVPIGGIGSGSITRGWKGDFVRWNLNDGLVSNEIIDVDKFSVYINFDSQSSTSTTNTSSTSSTPPLITPSSSTSSTSSLGSYNTSPPPVSVDQSSFKTKQKATVLYPGKPKSNLNLDVWNWSLKGDNSCYYGLFPRAWTVYQEPHPDIRLTCKQLSPVIPHNYKESSYPVGVYVWKIENNNQQVAAEVSLMLTWQNSIGTNSDCSGGHYNKYFHYDGNASNSSGKCTKNIKGITLHHRKEKKCTMSDGSVKSYFDPMEYSIAVYDDPEIEITYTERFETTSRLDAANLWYSFNKKGELENNRDSRPSAPKRPIGAGVAAKVKVPAGSSKTIVFTIAWDSPITRFQLGSAYYKRYTKFYGCDGGNSQRIAWDSINQYQDWDNQIVQWQSPILSDVETPASYKMALFNELYYFVDGGTVWTNGSPLNETPSRYPLKSQLKPEDTSSPEYIGRFAYLESLEYLMYNTYDVHFYSSYALIMLWPLLEISLQYDFADATLLDYGITWEGIHSGSQIPRKKLNTVPHDLGNPGEDPWKRVNAYCIQDISRWKDLPSKFVLQIYRDYLVVEDKKFLLQCYSVIEKVIQQTLELFDKDHDGVVDNEGFPDQTYDVWPALGCSAYTGGLWLAALKVASQIASILGYKEDESIYNTIFEKGAKSYNKKLWNGHYFNYDSSKSFHADSIMSDMLAGHWYLLSCGLKSYMTFDQALSSLSIINEYNVRSYGKEICGAVNGMRPEGSPDTTCLQSSEVWIGTSFSLAATMIQHHMDKDCWDLVKGIVNSSYNKWGFQYQTPEAWDQNGCFRAASYMRPLSIWSIQWSIQKRKHFDFYDESLKHNNNSGKSNSASSTSTSLLN